MVVSLDNFIHEPEKTYEAVFNFLGVNPHETVGDHTIMSSQEFLKPHNVNICKQGDMRITGDSAFECFEDRHQKVAELLEFK